MTREPHEIVQLKLRFRESLRERLEAAASGEGQSLNSAIVARLEQSFRKDRSLGGPAQDEIIRLIELYMDFASEAADGRWYDFHDTWEAVSTAVHLLLSAVEPTDSKAVLDDGEAAAAFNETILRFKMIGRRRLQRMIKGLSNEEIAAEAVRKARYSSNAP